MNDINVYLGREKGGGGGGQNRLEAYSFNVCPSIGVPNIHEAESLLLIVEDEEHIHKMCSFGWGPLTPSVSLHRH